MADLYINGINVNLEEPVHLDNGNRVPAGDYQVRALLLLGTADIKAHQELVLYAEVMYFHCYTKQLVSADAVSPRTYI